jgi:hypothetical protein
MTGTEGEGVHFQAPDGSFVFIERFAHHDDPAAVIEQVIEAMRKEYADLEVDPITSSAEWNHEAGKDLSFYCLDLLVMSRILAIREQPGKDHPSDVVMMQMQAESRDFDRLEDVFRAIWTSVQSIANEDRIG